MNRRRFFAVAAAVLAAPIAVVKGWFEKPNDPIGWKNWTATYVPPCETCDIGPTDCYSDNEYIGPEGPIVDLCDSCAEKQGYLCERRNWPHVDVFDNPDWRSCYCGKRGCPGNDVNWSNKIHPYKPPTPESIRSPR